MQLIWTNFRDDSIEHISHILQMNSLLTFKLIPHIVSWNSKLTLNYSAHFTHFNIYYELSCVPHAPKSPVFVLGCRLFGQILLINFPYFLNKQKTLVPNCIPHRCNPLMPGCNKKVTHT